MPKLNIQIKRTLNADKPFAVFIDGQPHGEFADATEARKYIQKTTALVRDPARIYAEPVEQSNDLSALKALDIIAFNQSAESRFVELVTAYLQEEGPQPVNAVIAEAAFELDISPATAKRYLLKHSARRAEFVVQEKLVRLRKPKLG